MYSSIKNNAAISSFFFCRTRCNHTLNPRVYARVRALFAGVPLLTLPGEQMASRVARSLVAATASLAPVRSLREYEAAAARLVAAPAPPQVYDTLSS